MHGGTMSLAVGEANCMKPCVPGRRMCHKGRPQDSLDHAIAIRLGRMLVGALRSPPPCS
jgi:hypothetical protein